MREPPSAGPGAHGTPVVPPAPAVPVCQVCGEALDGRREAVSCSGCRTPHHRDCWAFAGGCSTFGCGSAHAVPSAAGGQASEACSPGAVLRIDALGDGTVDGKPVRLPAGARPGTLVTLTGDPALDAATRYHRLDLDTPLEAALQGSAVLALLLAFPTHLPHVLWPLAGLLQFVRMTVDCTYLLDNRTSQILYARSILNMDQTWVVCRFDQVRSVGVAGSERSSEDEESTWTYAVILELPGGLRVKVSDYTSEFAQARGLAVSLARRLGAPLTEPRARSQGVDSGAWFPPFSPTHGPAGVPLGAGRAGFWSWVLLAVVVLANLTLVFLR